MRRPIWILSSFVLLAGAFSLNGCGPPSTAPSLSAAQPAQVEHGDHDHGEHGRADAVAIAEQLARLSPEDRAAAEKQKICPVSGEQLGSMGVPLKVTVDGHELFVCCEDCNKTLNKEPEKYLGKLPK